MKKTLTVNIGGVAFTLDDDAFSMLDRYLDDIGSRLYEEEKKEVMEDVESRIAVIFGENLDFPGQVVSRHLVQKTMAIIGNPSNFGDRRYGEPDRTDNGSPSCRLYRSRSNMILGGVCGGLADYFGVDASVIRLLTILLICFGGLSILVYIILWIIIPLEPQQPGSGQGINNRRRGQ